MFFFLSTTGNESFFESVTEPEPKLKSIGYGKEQMALLTNL